MPDIATVTLQDQLLDAAVRHAMRHPRASLAELAAAGGVSRTTLFKAFPTRDQLFHAMGVRAIRVVIDRLAPVAESGDLAELVAALLPVGPELDFLWRTPAFDQDERIGTLFQEYERQFEQVLTRSRAAGEVRDGLAMPWLAQLVQSVCYVAWQEVEAGRLARLDAPGQALEALLKGIGR
jgi:AcrR family transcriptional regulator